MWYRTKDNDLINLDQISLIQVNDTNLSLTFWYNTCNIRTIEVVDAVKELDRIQNHLRERSSVIL